MRIGLILPTIGAGAGPEGLEAAAGAAAAAGWNSVWVTDHLLVPAGPEADEYGWVLEATSALTWVAARFPDLRRRLQRAHPGDARRAAARQAARDDRLPDRRTSDRRRRRRATGTTCPSTRTSARPTASGDAVPTSTRRSPSGATSGAASTEPFEGEFHRLRDYNFQPLPPQGAAIPIWCGGRSDRAIRRSARLARRVPRRSDRAGRHPRARSEAARRGRGVRTALRSRSRCACASASTRARSASTASTAAPLR